MSWKKQPIFMGGEVLNEENSLLSSFSSCVRKNMSHPILSMEPVSQLEEFYL